MASIRIGFSSDFVLKNGVVGLGTTVGSTTDGKLELDNGALRADLSISGVATLTAYGGFVAQKQYVNKPAAIGFGTVGVGTHQQYYETTTEFTDLGGVHHGDDQRFNTLSEDLVIDDGQILNITNTEMVGRTTTGESDPHTHASYVCAGSLEQVSVTGHFSVPNGGINDRQSFIEGTVRFNTDIGTLEFFNGNEWRQFTYNQGQSNRAVFAGGYAPGPSYTTQSSMSYVNIASTGNALDFGSLVAPARTDHGAFSSSVRGVWHQSIGTPAAGESLDYVALASGGQAADFGDMNTDRTRSAALSSSTRGLIAGGYTHPARVNAIDYVQISTVGNALDFGDLSGNGILRPAPIASPTRGVFVGGSSPSPTPSPQGDDGIQYVTIASKGNSIDFSGLSLFSGGYSAGGVSNGVRGIYGGGNIDGSPGKTTTIGYLTLASIGQSQYFGDLMVAGSHHCGTSNATRGIFNSSDQVPNTAVYSNTIEYISISTQGNAIDFGDDVLNAGRRACTSDSHGGLGGF